MNKRRIIALLLFTSVAVAGGVLWGLGRFKKATPMKNEAPARFVIPLPPMFPSPVIDMRNLTYDTSLVIGSIPTQISAYTVSAPPEAGIEASRIARLFGFSTEPKTTNMKSGVFYIWNSG